MNKITCEIIKDLLPLYIDDVCSDDSKYILEEHISHCESCKKELENIKSELSLIDNRIYKDCNEIKDLESISKKIKKSKIKSAFVGIGVAICFCAIIFIGYLGLFCWSIVPIATEDLQVSEISKLTDGRFSYKYKKDYAYPNTLIKLSVDDEGNKYVTHYRSILPMQAKNKLTKDLYWVFDTDKLDSDIEIKAIYLGTEKDKKLMWEEGLSLPKASKDAEDVLTSN